MGVDKEKNKPFSNSVKPLIDEVLRRIGSQNNVESKTDVAERCTTTEYCGKLQAWMWQYYTGYVNWQSWLATSAIYPYHMHLASSTSMPHLDLNTQNWYNTSVGWHLSPYAPGASNSRAGEAAPGAAVPTQPQQHPQENGNAQRPGKGLS